MNLKRIKTTLAAGVLAASMIMPGLAVCAAPTNTNNYPTIAPDGDTKTAIEKIVNSPEGVTYTDKTFTFTFAQDKTANKTDSGVTIQTVDGKIPDATVTLSSTSATDADNDGIYTATASLDKVLDLSNIKDAGLYIYTVTETDGSTSNTDAEKWTYDTAKYRMRVYATWKNGVTHDKAENLEYTISIIKLNADGATEEGNKLEKASFTNYVEKTATFTLEKSVTDSDGVESMNQEYAFTVSGNVYKASEKSAAPSISYQIVAKGGTVNESGTWTTVTVTDNKFSVSDIKLKSGEKVVFKGLPAGSTITTEETTQLANIDSIEWKKTVGTTTDSTATKNAKAENILVDEQNSSVVYTNTWKNITITGVVTDIAPYITLVVVAIAGIAAYIGFKKRIAR